MKKVLSFVLTFVLLFAIVPFTVGAVDDGILLAIDDGNGSDTIEAGAGKVAKVYVKISGTSLTAGATVTINYDTDLELAYVQNGMVLADGTLSGTPFFADMSSSAIYGADFGGVDGTYVINVSHNMQNGMNVAKALGYLVTLSFKVPDDASVGKEFNVEINEDLTSIRRADTNYQEELLDFTVSNGKIAVVESNTCGEHDMKDTVVTESSYVTKGYAYSECKVCHAIEITKEDAYEIDIFGYEGVAIKYKGNPVGIAATFTIVDEYEQLEDMVNFYNCTYEIGTIAFCNGKKIQAVYYGDGSTHEMNGNKFYSIVLEGFEEDEVPILGSSDIVTFCAYIKITDKTEKTERIVYYYATLDGEEEISIYDVVVCMEKKGDIKKYPSDASQKYLNNVLNGF